MSEGQQRISFIIPSYQKGPFIEETLQSLVSQSSPMWEAIVVDNGSEDGSREIIDHFCANDDRFRLIDASSGEKNGSRSRNLGLAEAQGDYVVFLDADDVLAPTCVERRLAFGTGDEGTRFWVFPVGVFSGPVPRAEWRWVPEVKRPLEMLLFHGMSWHTMGTLWKKDFARSIGGFDERYARLQDVEMHIRALIEAGSAFRVASGHEPDAYYRAGTVAGNGAMLRRYVDSAATMFRCMPTLLEEKGLGHHRRYLSGTFQKITERIVREARSAEEAEERYAELRDAAESIGLSPRIRNILDWYWRTGTSLARRVKGVNFAVRKLLWTLS